MLFDKKSMCCQFDDDDDKIKNDRNQQKKSLFWGEKEGDFNIF